MAHYPQHEWHHSADVVVVGAGGAGLVAAIAARDHGATVFAIDANDDVGGRAIVSAGRIALGGGTSVQRRFGIKDSADRVYLDHSDFRKAISKYSDRDLVRVWADENAPTFEFLVENGVRFVDQEPVIMQPGTVARLCEPDVSSGDLNDSINGTRGSGFVRPLEKSARLKGVRFLMGHRVTSILRERPLAGRALGITAVCDGAETNIRATRGVILATGGHSSNVPFRRMFDPRLTEEYHGTGEPWTTRDAAGEIMAMDVGASLWTTANQSSEQMFTLAKPRHIGCRWGYKTLKWHPDSPVFPLARASGLTLIDFQNVILVNQVGLRFWNELDASPKFFDACLGTNGNLGRTGHANGGGPIWAIFDADAVARQEWTPRPPHVDPDGWFFQADSIRELASAIRNPYQRTPMPAETLDETVRTYNSYVDSGVDPEFGRPTPLYKLQSPPFYAAWATPMIHDSLTGLRTNAKCQVVDRRGAVIPGLYCAGESAGGFACHGLSRVTVFGRIAGREAARAEAHDMISALRELTS
jgi:succinate dehydrogenase/fumarate reductase flavoprotein subunit